MESIFIEFADLNSITHIEYTLFFKEYYFF